MTMAELDHTQRSALRSLEQDPTISALREIRWDKDCKSPKFISGTLSAPGTCSFSPIKTWQLTITFWMPIAVVSCTNTMISGM